jgi:hypothetical protein
MSLGVRSKLLCSLVSQRFDRIEIGGTHGGKHPADDPDYGQNGRGYGERFWRDYETNVAG